MPAAILGAVLIALILASSASAAIYGVTDIGTLGGETSQAWAINQKGEVTGNAETTELLFGVFTPHHAFRYSQGKMTDLQPHPESLPQACNGCSAGEAINDLGDVAGFDTGGSNESFGKVWNVDGSTGPATGSGATGINDAHEVIGDRNFGRSPWLITREGKLVELIEKEPCRAQEKGSASGINNLGQVVGRTWVPDPENPKCPIGYQAFLYSDGAMNDLGTLGGKDSSATAVNNTGTVVGFSEITGSTTEHAFSYRDGKMTDLGTLPGATESQADAVNDWGGIVGRSGGRAFIDVFGTMIDLNSLIPTNSGWTLTRANGINNFGEIVGTGLHNGVERGFILKPSWLWF